MDRPAIAPRIALDSPDAWINRELSWLAFARRVLDLARDADLPLLERVKFVGILGMLHDEFFMKRMGGLEQQVARSSTRLSPDGRTPAEELAACRAEIREQFANHDDPDTMALRNRLEDTDDWAVADAMQGFDIAMVARDVAEIGEVECALRRVADGSYGRCIDCDQPIPPARLNAYPAAARCIRCQEDFERRQG